MSTVGSRVKAEREAQGISRSALAKATGIGYSTIAELERGGMQTSTKLRVIADTLKVSLRWLETGRGPKGVQEDYAPSQSAGQQRTMIRIGVRAVAIMKEGGFRQITDENYADVLFEAMRKAQELGISEDASELDMVRLARAASENSG